MNGEDFHNRATAPNDPICPGSFRELKPISCWFKRIAYRSGHLAPILNDSLFDQGTDSATVDFVKEPNNV